MPGARFVWNRLNKKAPAPIELRDLAARGYDDSADADTLNDIRRLRRNNLFSRRAIVDPDSPVVMTMTTYAARVPTVFVAIESVARGDRLPSRHILYIDDPKIMAELPASLRRLQRRGLEIVQVPAGIKVHTKHYYYVTSIAHHTKSLATNEDDIIFPPDWLATMLAAQAEHPDQIVTPRAHRITLSDGRVTPYLEWARCSDTRPSYLNFGTTVSGQIYPPEFLDYVREAGDAFRDLCPNNDDLWLHHLAVESGRRVVQTGPVPQDYPFIPGTQSTGLYFSNVFGGENDRQIARTYTDADIERFQADAGVS